MRMVLLPCSGKMSTTRPASSKDVINGAPDARETHEVSPDATGIRRCTSWGAAPCFYPRPTCIHQSVTLFTSSPTINYIKVICKVSRSNSGEMATEMVSLSAYAWCHPSFVRPKLTCQKNGARLKNNNLTSLSSWNKCAKIALDRLSRDLGVRVQWVRPYSRS